MPKCALISLIYACIAVFLYCYRFSVNKDFITSKPAGGRCRVGVTVRTPAAAAAAAAAVRLEKRPRQLVNAARRGTCRRRAAACANHIVSTSGVRRWLE